jgi:hypothetical protein
MTEERIVICNDGKESKLPGNKATHRIIIVRRAVMSDLSEADRTKLADKPNAISDNLLNIGEAKFFPNPNDGRFTLTFNLLTKGTTKISIFDINGRQVYTEALQNFTGKYEKEIDISQQPKGSYFVKITQGSHSQIKKIVLD